MDLNAAKDINSATWKGLRLVAFFCFAVAGALLVASLVTPTRGNAEGGLAKVRVTGPPVSLQARL